MCGVWWSSTSLIRLYVQKASSAIASNCGPGSFGLLFMRRDDASLPFFQMPDQDRAA